MKLTSLGVAFVILSSPAFGQAKRPLKVEDIYNIREVRDPQRSPDGKWVAYTVDDGDQRHRQEQHRRLDGELGWHPAASSSHRRPKASRLLAGVRTASTSRSSRPGRGRRGGQVWLLNRAGGEAVKLTDIKGGVHDHAWSPDSKRLVLVVEDPDPAEKDADEPKDEKKTAEADRHRPVPRSRRTAAAFFAASDRTFICSTSIRRRPRP